MIVACGEALIDMVPEKDGAGRDLYAPCPGGSPYNTAVAAGRLLGKDALDRPRTAFLSRLSRDFFGETLVRRLEENNVSVELIRRSGENTTLAFVKLEEDREPAYIFYTEGAADRSLVPEDIPSRLPSGTDCILFGSISLTLEPSASAIEGLIFRERDRPGGPVISLDPNVRPMMIRDKDAYVRRFESWVHASAVVKISAVDFDCIYPGLGLEKSAERILSMGPRFAVVTLGAEGAMAFFRTGGGDLCRVPSPAADLPVADTIGAGDTFHGAFLAWLEDQGLMSRRALGFLKEGELREALDFANRAAALVCSRRGADPPFLAELQALV
ncbi:MAG: carbohydrate kinase [Treponema sp.]|nr:carbohydrate kinase [Treponema sp.]